MGTTGLTGEGGGGADKTTEVAAGVTVLGVLII